MKKFIAEYRVGDMSMISVSQADAISELLGDMLKKGCHVSPVEIVKIIDWAEKSHRGDRYHVGANGTIFKGAQPMTEGTSL